MSNMIGYDVPLTMLAAEVIIEDNESIIQLKEYNVPVPNADEVLICVRAAGVNRPDVLQRKGLYPPPADASKILGLEVSGVVVAVGSAVKNITLGSTVCALVNGGGYAQYCTAWETQCLPIPDGLNFIEAAALPETYFTVWVNLFERAQLKQGESVLIQGGSSGIGTTAIQLAKVFGAHVFTTASTDEKCSFCLKLGAEYVLNYKTEDIFSKIKELTQGNGVDVILDIVAGRYIEKELSILAVDGRLAIIGMMDSSLAQINVTPIIRRRLTITGSALRLIPKNDKEKIAKALQEKVWPLLVSQKIKPIIDKVFSFENANEAHHRMESGQHIGKIVLTWM